MFKKKPKQLDFLAIGDIVVDAFIELQDAQTHCDIDQENCTISMRWGDKIPYKDLTIVSGVGNAPNASVCLARLGLSTGILTHIGDDNFGRDCTESLKKNTVDTSLVEIQTGKKTNYHFVLSFLSERTILIKHEIFTYNLFKSLKKIEAPRFLYLSSVGENSLEYHADIVQYLQEHPETKLAFQPGTFQIALGTSALKEIYKHTEYIFCNKEEAQRILQTKEDEILKLLTMMRELGPKNIFITDGPQGAYAYDGADAWYHPIYPDRAPPRERTGAGDAFSSTVAGALTLGLTIPEALSWGPINSMNVVQEVGAQKGLLTKPELLQYLENAPADYKAKKIN